jgi:integrase
MKGSIFYHKNRGYWVVRWYDTLTHRAYNIYAYQGDKMWDRRYAVKLLSIMQARWEQHQRGECTFRIEEFTKSGWTDVIEYYELWMKNVTEPGCKPATIKGYWSYFRNWIRPYFERHPVRLHEIQLDTLTGLLNSITLSGKGKYNVMNAFHSMMDYAWRSRRIKQMPPFPKKEKYDIIEPEIRALPEDRQMSVIYAIPEADRPIFLFLKYHLRRPSEACALNWADYDQINRVFTIRRSVSARRVVKSTKTRAVHFIPCHPDFEAYMDALKPSDIDDYIFKNPRGRMPGKRYTIESLNVLWKKACAATGEDIDLYSGLKHSSCSQYVNEKGLSIYDLQELTDHARLESVKRYAKVSMARKKEMMRRGKVIELKSIKGKKEKD